MNFFPNSHLATNTLSAYNSKINKWISIMTPPHNTLPFIYTHPNFSIVQLRQFLSLHNTDTAVTINSYIKAIMSAFDHNPSLFSNIHIHILQNSDKRWKELRQNTYETAFAYRIEQKPSPTQALKSGVTLSFNDLTTQRDLLPDGSIDKLLLAFYTFIPPVRADFFATQLLPFDHTPSYPNHIFYNSEKSKLVITDFKTSHVYGSIEHDLPPPLHTQLILSLQQNPRSFLFQNNFNKSFTRKCFSEWAANKLQNIFGKKITLTMIRHLFISSLDPNTPAKRLLEISKQMGHTITQQMLYKWRDDDTE